MRRPKTDPRILCYASIIALSVSACSHHGTKPKGHGSLTDEARAASTDDSGRGGLSPFGKKGSRWFKRGARKTLAGGGAAKYDDLWDRLFDLYELPPIEHGDIDRELDWFARHPEYIDRVQTRAEPFLYSIVKQVEKHQLPGEIALLPVIESAFQPRAVSPARAAGIWQFIPSTGRHYGLKQSRNYDGRRDIYASTRAAVKYLKKLHGDFSGDWLLAIAAYNCGEGAVGRAIQKNLARGLPTDFWSLDLPSETRTYVPRLLAVSRLFADSEHYGIDLHPIPNRAVYKPVKVSDQVDLALAADAADISIDKMMELNPGFKRPISDISGTYRLFIPAEKKAADFKRELNRLAQESRVYERPETAQAEPFEIEKAAPAEDRRLFQSTRPEIRPPTASSSSVVAYADLNERSYVPPARPEKSEVDVEIAAPVEIAPAESSFPRERRGVRDHRSNESLKKEEAPKKRVREAVLTRDSEVRPPERVSHEPQEKSRHESAAKEKEHGGKAVAAPPPEPKGKRLSYTVQSGDTLFSIARKRGVDVNELARWNSVPLNYGVKKGEDVVLWSKDEPKKAQSPAPAAHSAAPSSYTVREGDTLFSISRRFNVSVAELRKLNGAKVDKQVQTGRTIKLPKDKN